MNATRNHDPAVSSELVEWLVNGDWGELAAVEVLDRAMILAHKAADYGLRASPRSPSATPRRESARETLARLGGTMPTEEQQRANLLANGVDPGPPESSATPDRAEVERAVDALLEAAYEAMAADEYSTMPPPEVEAARAALLSLIFPEDRK